MLTKLLARRSKLATVAMALYPTVALLALGAPRALAQNTCATATPATIGTPLSGNNAAAPGDGVGGQCAATSHPVWHSFIPAITGNHNISLCGSAIDSVATLYSACDGQVLACDNSTCGNDAVLVARLNAGQAYFLRVAALEGTTGGAYTLLITASTQEPPVNETCSAAVPLTPNTTARGSNIGAAGADNSSCGVFDTSDVWYSYSSTIAGTHVVEVCASSFAPVVSVHNSCIGGQSTVCNNGAAVDWCGGIGAATSFNAAAGQPIQIRVAGERGSFGVFDIIIHTPRPNDLCSSAQVLLPGVPFAGLTTPIVATEASVPCAGSEHDAWHAFTPAITGVHTVSTCGSGFDTVLSVHSACPGTPGSSVVACNDNACQNQSSISTQLTGGVTYFLRVAGKVGGSTPTFGSYNIVVTQQAPSNDLCGQAIVLPMSKQVDGSNIAATGVDLTLTCGDDQDFKDVWYSFTPAFSAVYELNTCGSTLDTTLAVFSSCASTTPLACNNNDPAFCGQGTSGSRVVLPMNAGQTYLVRVSSIIGGEGLFTLSVNPTPPTNTRCENPERLSTPSIVTATLTGDAPSSGLSACGVGDGPDAWFSFTPDQTRFWRFDTCGSVLSPVLSLYETCPPSPLLACSAAGTDDCDTGIGTSLTVHLRANTVYRLRVGADPQWPLGGAFRLFAMAVAPPNDDCFNALDIPLNVPTVGSNSDATTTGSSACSLQDFNDVWFRFVPPASGSYQFSTCGNETQIDTVLSLHAQCNAGPMACSETDACNPLAASLQARLDAGVSYFVRVAGKNGTKGSFVLTARIGTPVNDACQSALTILEGSTAFDTLGATTDAAFLDLSCSAGFNLISNDVWFRYTPAASGTVSASLCGASFDTAIAVSLAAGGCPSGLYTVIGCNDDAPCPVDTSPITPQSRLSWAATAGTTYFLRVGSRTGGTGAGLLRIDGLTGGCRCDWNRSGSVTVQDVFDFINGWFVQQGDFDSDGVTEVQDIFDFLQCVFSDQPGC